MSLQFRGKYQLRSAHDGAITCVAFSCSGDYVASGGLDRKLQIFSLADGRLQYSLITPSPIKSLIWLPGTEEMLVCACNKGILLNVTIIAGVSNYLVSELEPSHSPVLKVTTNLSYFQVCNHAIDFMAVSLPADYLATGAGVDVQIWKGDGRRTLLSPSFIHSLSSANTCLQIIGRDLDVWVFQINVRTISTKTSF